MEFDLAGMLTRQLQAYRKALQSQDMDGVQAAMQEFEECHAAIVNGVDEVERSLQQEIERVNQRPMCKPVRLADWLAQK